MEPAKESRYGRRLSALLAGFQAGMLGAFVYLFWIGVSAAWRGLSFWTAANLMASVFYGGAAIHRGFAFSTVSGIALYVIIFSLLGALFAVAAPSGLPRLRLALLSIVFAVCWYYLGFRVISKWAAPLVWLLHVESSTLIGHVIYGAMLARYPKYLKNNVG